MNLNHSEALSKRQKKIRPFSYTVRKSYIYKVYEYHSININTGTIYKEIRWTSFLKKYVII